MEGSSSSYFLPLGDGHVFFDISLIKLMLINKKTKSKN
jgi:hypothetical protein